MLTGRPGRTPGALQPGVPQVNASPAHDRCALVAAHPGHELRIHGWLERARPTVFLLTDGSGSTRESRVESTRRVLRDAGATEGAVFGRFPDRRFYEAVRSRDFGVFVELADELAASLVALQIDVVAADAREDYNPAHDVCRAVADAAIAIAEHVANRAIRSLDFLLVGRPDDCSNGAGVRLRLDDAALARKLAAARGYPEMAAEVDAALGQFGEEAFRIECLRPVTNGDMAASRVGAPFYEQYGERQVASGLYADVIRARDHIDPLVAALRDHALERTRCGA